MNRCAIRMLIAATTGLVVAPWAIADPKTPEFPEPRLVIQEDREVDVGAGRPPRGDRGGYGRKPGEHRPPFSRPGGAPPFDPPAPGGGAPGAFAGPDGRRPIDRLMEHLKATAPDRYERMSALRDSDPEAFRQELRVLFEEAARRFGRGDGRRPDLPRRSDGESGPRPPPLPGGDDRAGRRPDAANMPDGPAPHDPRRQGQGGPPGHRMDGHAGAGGPHDERIDFVRKWAAEYRQADASGKDAIRKRVRDTIAQVHLSRERERIRRIEHMEADLRRLKEEMAERRDRADSLIDKAVEDILARDP